MDAALRVSCLPGTRQDLLKEIIDWLMTPSEGQSVLWLHGAAGLGKSTLANSIAEYFSGIHRRGAFLFFDRNTPIDSHPARVIRTLVYQLAEHYPAIKSALASAIEANPQVTSAPLNTQFTVLFIETLWAASDQVTGPVVVIIEALDECGDVESRNTLLSLLSRDLTKLPPQFRFLITSRPDTDIAGAFTSASHIHAISLSTLPITANSADIQLYIEHEMNQIYSRRHLQDELPTDWPGPIVIQRLTAFAGGLFICAATAMKYLLKSDDPVEWLSKLLTQDRQAFTLDELYKTALLSASQWEPGDATDVFRKVLAVIVISRVPLDDATIIHLLGLENFGRQCRNTLRRLGCVIQWREGEPARMLHKSFPDYLTDRSRCSSEPWFVDMQEHHRTLTIRCFEIMNSGLHFNICDLRTSHLFNKDVMDLNICVQSHIPRSLAYACRFWIEHLDKTPTGDDEIIALLREFFEHQFLYWLEVLSLLEQIPTATMAFVSVKSYVKVSRILGIEANALLTADYDRTLCLTCMPSHRTALLSCERSQDRLLTVFHTFIFHAYLSPLVHPLSNGNIPRLSQTPFSLITVCYTTGRHVSK